MSNRVEIRGVFEYAQGAFPEKEFALLANDIPDELFQRIIAGRYADNLLNIWESWLDQDREMEAISSFLHIAAASASAGMMYLRSMGEEPTWLFPNHTAAYEHPAPKTASKLDFFPLDASKVYTYRTSWKGAEDTLKVYYEQFPIGETEIFCVRPNGGGHVPPWFIHWANYHFMREGNRLYLEVEGNQIAPDLSTLERLEYILDVSGQEDMPTAYIHEEKGFFQIHIPQPRTRLHTPNYDFEDVLPVEVLFFWIGDGLNPIQEKVTWYFADGKGLVGMKGKDGEIMLESIEEITRKKSLLSL